MKKIFDYIENAVRISSNELRVSTNSRPLVRSKKGWQPLSEEVMSPKWVREQFLSLLSNEEQAQLIEKGVMVGSFAERENKNKKIHFVFSKMRDGFHGHFHWSEQKIVYNDFGLPGAVIEVVKKTNGLSIVVGPQSSGKSTLLQAMASEISNTSLLSIAFFSDKEVDLKSEQVMTFSTEVMSFDQEVVRGFDLVIVDSVRVFAWRQALALAESGVQILMTMPFQNIETALQRLSEKVEAQAHVGMSRVVSCLQMSLGLRLVPATEKNKQVAFELLFVTREIRTALKAGNWEQVDLLMASLGEKTGMKTLNQCLMNLMLTRKIDLKSGFTESPRPDELDKMLEKVGF